MKIRLLAALLPALMAYFGAYRGVDQILGMVVLMLILYAIYIRGQKNTLMRIMSGVVLIFSMVYLTPWLVLPYLGWLAVVYFLLKFHRTQPLASAFIRVHYVQTGMTFGALAIASLLVGQLSGILYDVLKLFGLTTLMKTPLLFGYDPNSLLVMALLIVVGALVLMLTAMPLMGKHPKIPFIDAFVDRF